MKMVEAIVRPERMEDVKEELKNLGIGGMTVSDAKGRGLGRPIELQFKWRQYFIDLIPKVKFEIVVRDEDVKKVVEAILKAAHTGERGDGKIFVHAIEEAYDITTKEKDAKAL